MKIEPYDLPGRFYRVFLESDGTAYQVTSADIAVTIESTNTGAVLVLPTSFVANMAIPSFNLLGDCEEIANITFKQGRYIISLPPVSACDYGYVYVYGLFERERG